MNDLYILNEVWLFPFSNILNEVGPFPFSSSCSCYKLLSPYIIDILLEVTSYNCILSTISRISTYSPFSLIIIALCFI